jgi:hypothetical protein
VTGHGKPLFLTLSPYTKRGNWIGGGLIIAQMFLWCQEGNFRRDEKW